MSERGEYSMTPRPRSSHGRGYGVRSIIVGGQVPPAVPSGGRRLPSLLLGKWFHSVSDREKALDHIGDAFAALSADLATWQTANAHEPNATAAAQWLAADVTPTINEWGRFRARQAASWMTMAGTSWDAYEAWQDRVVRLRELARAHGIVLESHEPGDLPKTIWQTSSEGEGGRVETYVGLGKVAVVTAIGAMGIWGLYAALRDMTKAS